MDIFLVNFLQIVNAVQVDWSFGCLVFQEVWDHLVAQRGMSRVRIDCNLKALQEVRQFKLVTDYIFHVVLELVLGGPKLSTLVKEQKIVLVYWRN